MNIINCDWITKSYSNGKIALEDITLSIEKGEKVGLIGPIGAGKTTLLRILAGVLSITSGTINIGAEKNKIAYMPASKGLIRALSVQDHIKMWAQASGASKEDTAYIIKTLRLERVLDKEIKNLSSGTQTMVSFGCTVLGKPELVLLDEPFVNLDVNSCLKIEEVMRNFLSDSSIIISSHDLERVDELSDTLLVIDHGKQILYNKADKLKELYSDKYFKICFEGRLQEQWKNKMKNKYGTNFLDSSNVYFDKNRITIDSARELLQKEGCNIRNICASCSELKDIYLNIVNLEE